MDNWAKFNFGDEKYAELIMGQSPPSSSYNKKGIGLPFFQGKKEFGELYPTAIKWCDNPKKIAKEGDVLLSVRAPVGPTNLASEECCIGRGLAAIRPNTETVLTEFLLYYFQNFELEIASKGQGSTFQAISSKELRSLEVPLPSIEEQKRLVLRLKSLFAKIDKAILLLKENIKHTRALMGSVLDEKYQNLVENYGSTPLIDVCEKITDGSHHSPETFSEGIPYVTVRDVSWEGEIDLENCKKVKERDYLELRRNGCEPITGDVLLSKDGTVGKVALVNFNEKWVVLSSLAIIRPHSEKLESQFLCWMLRTPIIQERAIGLKTGAAIKRIVLRTIKLIEIPVPDDLEVQKEITTFLDMFIQPYRKLEMENLNKLENLDALKKSLLDKAFKGEL